MPDRPPPHDLEMERIVLGAMLSAPKECVPRALSILRGSLHFYATSHQAIYSAISECFEEKIGIDTITVGEQLKSAGRFKEIGGYAYLAECASAAMNPQNIEHYCRHLIEKSMKRQMIAMLRQAEGACYDDKTDAFDTLSDLEKNLYDVGEHAIARSYVEMAAIMPGVVERIRRIGDTHSGVTGVGTGLYEIDKRTGGWQKSDLVIIAARPSVGKTALALGMARNAAIDLGAPIGFFSLEMSKEQLALRLLCAEARVPMQKVNTGRIYENDRRDLELQVPPIARMPLIVDDTPGISIMELRSKAYRMMSEHSIQAIYVDYLQLMTVSGRMDSREREIATISRSLKALAKDLAIPVIALSQLNRAVEQRTKGKPQLSDLRESGAIEQDADVVLFIHREKSEDGEPESNRATIIIGKQRNGETGEFHLAWLAEYATFENLDTLHLPPPAPERADPYKDAF